MYIKSEKDIFNYNTYENSELQLLAGVKRIPNRNNRILYQRYKLLGLQSLIYIIEIRKSDNCYICGTLIAIFSRVFG